MIANLRTLTRKSKLGFGKNANYTIQELLNRNKKVDLVCCYYKLTSINFTPDILDELKITEQFRIKKPSKNKLLFKIVLSFYPRRSINHINNKIDKLKTKPKISKSQLQSRNHGK